MTEDICGADDVRLEDLMALQRISRDENVERLEAVLRCETRLESSRDGRLIYNITNGPSSFRVVFRFDSVPRGDMFGRFTTSIDWMDATTVDVLNRVFKAYLEGVTGSIHWDNFYPSHYASRGVYHKLPGNIASKCRKIIHWPQIYGDLFDIIMDPHVQ